MFVWKTSIWYSLALQTQGEAGIDLFFGTERGTTARERRRKQGLWKARQTAYVPSTERRSFVTALRQIQTMPPSLTSWITESHKPNSSAMQPVRKKNNKNAVWSFINKVAAFAISLSKEQFSSLPATLSASIQKCSRKKCSAFTHQQYFPFPHQSTMDYTQLPLLATQLQPGGKERTGNFPLGFLLVLKSF